MKDINLPHGLLAAVAECIYAAPGGQSEFELIQRLDKDFPQVFPKPDLTDPLLLFQHHFVLMHALYRLQQQWWRQGKGLLEIRPLNICFRVEVSSTEQALSQDLSLAEYYLDWRNLAREDSASVDALLTGFWKKLLDTERRPEALETLGLPETANKDEVRQRYRQLVQQHHPDKGGDPAVFQEVQAAYESLTVGMKR
ncbi:MAG: DnaJ domain-containing protein [Saccharospirillum sp.]|nr:DnaJ domain-containing protein [Saccharospirillum sp.]